MTRVATLHFLWFQCRRSMSGPRNNQIISASRLKILSGYSTHFRAEARCIAFMPLVTALARRSSDKLAIFVQTLPRSRQVRSFRGLCGLHRISSVDCALPVEDGLNAFSPRWTKRLYGHRARVPPHWRRHTARVEPCTFLSATARASSDPSVGVQVLEVEHTEAYG